MIPIVPSALPCLAVELIRHSAGCKAHHAAPVLPLYRPCVPPCRELMYDGVHVDSIHADQSQAARQAAVDNFR